MTDAALALAREVLAAQPFSDLVGARVTAFGGGTATLEVDIETRLLQQFGLVHGGVISYLVDNAVTFAAGSVLGPSVVTGALNVHYLKGARDGTLRATSSVAHRSLRQAVCTVRVEAHAPDGATVLCAIGTGTVLATGTTRPADGAAVPSYVLVRSEDLRLGPALADYVRSVDESLDRHGAEILVQNLPGRVLEGEWPGFVTLLRFPDRAAAERWYDSPEYVALRHLRQDSSTPAAIIVDGVGPGHRSADLAEMFGLG